MDLKAIKFEAPQKGLEEYVEEFLSDRLSELELLYQSLESNQFNVLSEYAHKWKGFSAPYGFNFLENLSSDLESFSKKGDRKNCLSKLNDIKAYLDLKKENLS